MLIKILKQLQELFGGESQKYFPTSMGKRFVDQFLNDVIYESKVGYTSLTKRVKLQALKDVEILKNYNGIINNSEWHFFKRSITGKVGASKDLLKFLEGNGIKPIIH